MLPTPPHCKREWRAALEAWLPMQSSPWPFEPSTLAARRPAFQATPRQCLIASQTDKAQQVNAPHDAPLSVASVGQGVECQRRRMNCYNSVEGAAYAANTAPQWHAAEAWQAQPMAPQTKRHRHGRWQSRGGWLKSESNAGIQTRGSNTPARPQLQRQGGGR